MEVDKKIAERARNLCNDFLGGSWGNARAEDFTITAVTGGLTNVLYKCSLGDKVALLPGEKRHILLRMYGNIVKNNPEMAVIDPLVFGLLAAKGIGPQVFGVFLDGRLEEYLPSRPLITSELHNPDISRRCARIMASFHMLTLPLSKMPRRVFDSMQEYLDATLNNLTHDESDDVKAGKVSKLLSYNLPNEVVYMKSLLSKVDSPVVFCHNDLQEGNILYVESTENGKNAEWYLQPIDFEYSCYNYRGFDIGNHFCEWCYDYNVDSPPYFSASLDAYPSVKEQINFIRAYLQDEDPSDENIEKVRLEANAFALASHMLWALWGAAQSLVSNLEFDCLEYALVRLEHYTKQKADVLDMLQEDKGR